MPTSDSTVRSRAKKRVTLKTLADSCGISVAAVSQCLRNPDNTRFSEATRRKVAETARRFNYVPNGLAANLREGRTRALNMVIPWNTPEMLDEAELEAKRHGYSLSINFTVSPDLDAERKAIAHAVSQRSAGLLWMPSNTAWGYTRTIDSLRQSGIQTVFLESALPHMPDAGVVEIDYKSALRESVDCLQRQGSSNFLLFTRDLAHKPRNERAEDFRHLCREYGVAATVISVESADQLPPVLDDCPGGSTVICEGDWLAIDLLRAAERLQRSFTGDLHLISIADLLVGGRYRIGEIAHPRFSAIRRPSGELARRAVAALIEQIENPESAEPPRVRLTAEFIRRETTPTGLRETNECLR